MYLLAFFSQVQRRAGFLLLAVEAPFLGSFVSLLKLGVVIGGGFAMVLRMLLTKISSKMMQVI